MQALDWFNREKEYSKPEAGNEEYNSFLEKHKPKKTTDDCYTPDAVYDAVAGWVAKEYGLDRAAFVRPFYPGGDFENEEYDEGAVVVDNPPFSILSQIIDFYVWRGIKFFLFAQSKTLFATSKMRCCAVCVGAEIIYENGARVGTSFVTNLERGVRVRSAPALYDAIKAAQETEKRTPPRYVYPEEVLTFSSIDTMSKNGVEFSVREDESAFVRKLRAQGGKAIYGGGYLLSRAAAAMRAAAEAQAKRKAQATLAATVTVWSLEAHEQEVVKRLSRGGD